MCVCVYTNPPLLVLKVKQLEYPALLVLIVPYSTNIDCAGRKCLTLLLLKASSPFTTLALMLQPLYIFAYSLSSLTTQSYKYLQIFLFFLQVILLTFYDWMEKHVHMCVNISTLIRIDICLCICVCAYIYTHTHTRTLCLMVVSIKSIWYLG